MGRAGIKSGKAGTEKRERWLSGSSRSIHTLPVRACSVAIAGCTVIDLFASVAAGASLRKATQVCYASIDQPVMGVVQLHCNPL